MKEPFCPTEEEIRIECLKIQESWTDKERHERAGIPMGGGGVIPFVGCDRYYRRVRSQNVRDVEINIDRDSDDTEIRCWQT